MDGYKGNENEIVISPEDNGYGGDIDPELVIVIALYFLDDFAHILGVQTDRAIGHNRQAHRSEVIALLPEKFQ